MLRTAFLALLALLLPLCTSTASVPHDEYEVEFHDLQGTWRVTSAKLNGRYVSVPEENRFWHVTFVGQHRFQSIRGKDCVSYQIDPGYSPSHIDIFEDWTPGEKPVTRGIYRLSGNRLTICWGTRVSRPDAFVCKPGAQTILVELVRVK